MKLKIFLMSVFVLMMLSLSTGDARNPLPDFYVHVKPITTCSGNVSGATVTITYTGGSQQGTTDVNG